MQKMKNSFAAIILLAGVLVIGQTVLLPTTATASCWSGIGACLNICNSHPNSAECWACMDAIKECMLTSGPEWIPWPLEDFEVVSDDPIDPNEDYFLSFGRFDGDDFLIGQGTVLEVDIYYIGVEDFDSNLDIYQNNFLFDGNAVFNDNANSWNYHFIPPVKNKAGSGYIIRADFHDPNLPDSMLSACAGAFPSTDIPTLTEWGIIIFCVLLFGWMAWMIVKRRKTATINI